MPNVVVNPKMKSMLINNNEPEKCLIDTFRGEKFESIFLTLMGVEIDIYFLTSAVQKDGVFNISDTLPISFCGKSVIRVKDSQFANAKESNEFCVKLTKNIVFA